MTAEIIFLFIIWIHIRDFTASHEDTKVVIPHWPVSSLSKFVTGPHTETEQWHCNVVLRRCVFTRSLLNLRRVTLPPDQTPRRMFIITFQIIRCHNPEDRDNLKSRKVCEIIFLGKLAGYVITEKGQNQIIIKLDSTEYLQLMFIYS
jgi:hypothetical protein